ncbi:MAG: septum formation protein Maf [Bacteroidales bacterium]|nr:septum formation protein Maf [Bacteroidales bacterium]
MLKELLGNRKLVLASASPRRKELLAGLGVDFTIDTGSTFKEISPEGMPLVEIPEYMAKGKSYGFHRPLMSDEILITADTMVLCADEIMGKPADREDAVRMLLKLQDNRHQVLTGVCIRSLGREVSFTASTEVAFGKLSMDEIDYYIDNYKPYDKAGAYGVQEWIGYAGIKGIEGSYFNVVGLPVHLLYRRLKEFLLDE